MLAVTKPALKRLEVGRTLCVDRESPGGTTFNHDGRTVPLLNTEVSQAMARMPLDAKETGRRSRLRLRRDERRGD